LFKLENLLRWSFFTFMVSFCRPSSVLSSQCKFISFP